MQSTRDITRLLDAVADGGTEAFDELFPIVYNELRRIANGRMRGERRDHTLNATALVHEAYLKLVRFDQIRWQSRAHFFAIASQVMRNILVDYAVARKAQKRGGDNQPISLDENLIMTDDRVEEMLALDDALKHLEKLDPRQARVVECRFFGDLSIDETAEVLNVSPATVSRDWTMARAWLNRELG
jgi:RNA polymerase sigma factor (TIGR02999 family)